MAFDLTNPLVTFVLSLLTFIFILAGTGPNSIVRPLGLGLMSFYVFLVLYNPVHRPLFTHQLYPNLAGGSTFNLGLKYWSTILLQRWSYEANGPTRTINGQPILEQQKKMEAKKREGKQRPLDIFSRLSFATRQVFEGRYSGTPWEVRNVPPFDANNLARVPSRTEFILKNTIRSVICMVLLDIIGQAGKDTSQNSVIFDQRKVAFFSRFGDVTGEEVAVRVFSSLTTALVTYLLFQAIYAGSGVLMVALGLSPVESWRPLFGSITEIRSLRNTWNKFWHQGMGYSLRYPSHYITTNILHLEKHSLLGKYVYAMLVFQLSGIVHIVGDVAAGVSVRDSGVMQWFSIQALGFIIEDTFIALYRKITGTKARPDSKIPTWQKIFGFIWVCAWMVWTMPVWTYPISKESDGKGVLPFSFVQYVS